MMYHKKDTLLPSSMDAKLPDELAMSLVSPPELLPFGDQAISFVSAPGAGDLDLDFDHDLEFDYDSFLFSQEASLETSQVLNDVMSSQAVEGDCQMELPFQDAMDSEEENHGQFGSLTDPMIQKGSLDCSLVQVSSNVDVSPISQRQTCYRKYELGDLVSVRVGGEQPWSKQSAKCPDEMITGHLPEKHLIHTDHFNADTSGFGEASLLSELDVDLFLQCSLDNLSRDSHIEGCHSEQLTDLQSHLDAQTLAHFASSGTPTHTAHALKESNSTEYCADALDQSSRHVRSFFAGGQGRTDAWCRDSGFVDTASVCSSPSVHTFQTYLNTKPTFYLVEHCAGGGSGEAVAVEEQKYGQALPTSNATTVGTTFHDGHLLLPLVVQTSLSTSATVSKDHPSSVLVDHCSTFSESTVDVTRLPGVKERISCNPTLVASGQLTKVALTNQNSVNRDIKVGLPRVLNIDTSTSVCSRNNQTDLCTVRNHNNIEKVTVLCPPVLAQVPVRHSMSDAALVYSFLDSAPGQPDMRTQAVKAVETGQFGSAPALYSNKAVVYNERNKTYTESSKNSFADLKVEKETKPIPSKRYRKSSKQRTDSEKGKIVAHKNSSKCPRLFPPRHENVFSSGNSENHNTMQNPCCTLQSTKGVQTLVTLNQCGTTAVGYPLTQQKETCGFEGEALKLSGNEGERFASKLGLETECKAQSLEASEKIHHISSACSVGKPKTGQGELSCGSAYKRSRTVRELLKIAAVQTCRSAPCKGDTKDQEDGRVEQTSDEHSRGQGKVDERKSDDHRTERQCCDGLNRMEDCCSECFAEAITDQAKVSYSSQDNNLRNINSVDPVTADMVSCQGHIGLPDLLIDSAELAQNQASACLKASHGEKGVFAPSISAVSKDEEETKQTLFDTQTDYEDIASLLAQLSPSSQSQNSFALESRRDINRLTRALPTLDSTDYGLPVTPNQCAPFELSVKNNGVFDQCSEKELSDLNAAENVYCGFADENAPLATESGSIAASQSTLYQRVSSVSHLHLSQLQNDVLDSFQQKENPSAKKLGLCTQADNSSESGIESLTPNIDPLEAWMDSRTCDNRNQKQSERTHKEDLTVEETCKSGGIHADVYALAESGPNVFSGLLMPKFSSVNGMVKDDFTCIRSPACEIEGKLLATDEGHTKTGFDALGSCCDTVVGNCVAIDECAPLRQNCCVSQPSDDDWFLLQDVTSSITPAEVFRASTMITTVTPTSLPREMLCFAEAISREPSGNQTASDAEFLKGQMQEDSPQRHVLKSECMGDSLSKPAALQDITDNHCLSTAPSEKWCDFLLSESPDLVWKERNQGQQECSHADVSACDSEMLNDLVALLSDSSVISDLSPQSMDSQRYPVSVMKQGHPLCEVSDDVLQVSGNFSVCDLQINDVEQRCFNKTVDGNAQTSSLFRAQTSFSNGPMLQTPTVPVSFSYSDLPSSVVSSVMDNSSQILVPTASSSPSLPLITSCDQSAVIATQQTSGLYPLLNYGHSSIRLPCSDLTTTPVNRTVPSSYGLIENNKASDALFVSASTCSVSSYNISGVTWNAGGPGITLARTTPLLESGMASTCHMSAPTLSSETVTSPSRGYVDVIGQSQQSQLQVKTSQNEAQRNTSPLFVTLLESSGRHQSDNSTVGILPAGQGHLSSATVTGYPEDSLVKFQVPSSSATSPSHCGGRWCSVMQPPDTSQLTKTFQPSVQATRCPKNKPVPAPEAAEESTHSCNESLTSSVSSQTPPQSKISRSSFPGVPSTEFPGQGMPWSVPVSSATVFPSDQCVPLVLPSLAAESVKRTSSTSGGIAEAANRSQCADEEKNKPDVPCKSQAMLNYQAMTGFPPVAACQQLPYVNPCCVGEGVYEYRPTPGDIHAARTLLKNCHKTDSGDASSKDHVGKVSYRIHSIHIGDFMLTVDDEKYSKNSNVCIIFMERKLCYRMILAQPMENSTFQGRVITTEVDFSSIVGLWGADNRLLVEVNEAPVTFVAGKLSTRKQEPIDLSGGQIQKAPYHFLIFQQKCATNIKRHLCSEPSFCHLLLHPVAMDLHKSLSASDTPILSSKERGVGCKCNKACRQKKCKCLRMHYMCTRLCWCQGCQNPLNQLQRLKLSMEGVRSDPCLLDRMLWVKDIPKFLTTEARLPCCGEQTTFLRCVPGQQQCPKCSAPVRLSWCFGRVYLDAHTNYGHCVKCKKCSENIESHNEICESGAHGKEQQASVKRRRGRPKVVYPM